MPMSSAEIAQLAGGYQQQAIQNMQYATMIGQYGFQSGQQYRGLPNDMRVMRGMEMGQGAASLAGNIFGTVGLGAGVIGGGLAGGAMGMVAGAGLSMGVGAMASYAGDNFMQGGRQQLALNNTLRSSFTHITPYGRGFDRGEMGQVGGLMRSMTGEYGMAGQMTNMSELTALAGNMGQMGMSKGLTDVQDFTRRFRELVTTVKAVATELGTSLEGATSLIQGMRGSGIFKSQDQLKMLGMAKGASLTGNMSLESVMASGNMGAQISRAIGGRSKAGMIAGIKTAGMVGGAVDQGYLSDEDLYEATGLEGEGARQAFGSSLMQLNASFLRSTRGRRLIASMAGKDGKLDADSLGEYLGAGGFSRGATGRNVGKNLGKVGRAGFIRNEGRLRGELLAADPMVGLRQTMAWLEDRGMDLDSDYGRVGLQRQLRAGGMNVGREELDAMIKLMRNEDNIGELGRQRAGQNDFLNKIGTLQKTTGINGLKLKVDHAKHDVESVLQKAGQDFFNAGSDALDRFVSNLTKAYVQRYSKDASEAFREAAGGGSTQKWEAMFGGGGSFLRNSTAARKMGSSELYRRLNDAGDTGRLKDAGYSLREYGDTTNQMNYFREIEAGTRALSKEGLSFGQQNRDVLREAVARGQISGQGLDRIRSFEAFFGDQDGMRAGDKRELNKYLKGVAGEFTEVNARGRSARQRGSYVRSAMQQAGIDSAEDYSMPELHMNYLMSTIEGRTLRERGEILGKAVMGNGEFGSENYRAGLGKGETGGFKEWLKVGANEVYRGVAGLAGYDPLAAKYREAGMFMDSDKGQGLMRQLFGKDEDVRQKAMEENRTRRIELQKMKDSKKKLSDAEVGELDMRGALSDASEIHSRVQKGMTIDEAAADAAKNIKGFNVDTAKKAYAGGQYAVQRQAAEAVRNLATQLGKEGREERDNLLKAGAIVEGENGLDYSDETKKSFAGNEELQKYSAARLRSIKERVAAGTAGSDLEKHNRLERAMYMEQEASTRMQGMSTEDLRKGAEAQRSAGFGADAARFERAARRQGRFEKLAATKGSAQAVASSLGIELDAETRKQLVGKKGDEQARIILEQYGVTDQATVASVTAAINGKGSDGKALKSGERLAALDMAFKPLQEAKKKDKESNDRQSNPLLAKVADGIDAMTKGINIAAGAEVGITVKTAIPVRMEKP